MNTDNVISRLTQKHPINYGISASENTHCVLGTTIYAFVELEDEKLMYKTDARGRLLVCKRETLTPTYKSVRLQPKDSAVIIRGGNYDGHYVVKHQGEGWLKTTTDISEVTAMSNYDTADWRNYIGFHAQYCYRGQFEVVAIK
jgi:hypothetical protein